MLSFEMTSQVTCIASLKMTTKAKCVTLASRLTPQVSEGHVIARSFSDEAVFWLITPRLLRFARNDNEGK